MSIRSHILVTTTIAIITGIGVIVAVYLSSNQAAPIAMDVEPVKSVYLEAEPCLIEVSLTNTSAKRITIDLGWRRLEKFMVRKEQGPRKTTSTKILGDSSSGRRWVTLPPRGRFQTFVPVEQWVDLAKGTNRLVVVLDAGKPSQVDRPRSVETIPVANTNMVSVVIESGTSEELMRRIGELLQLAVAWPAKDENGNNSVIIRDELIEKGIANKKTLEALKAVQVREEEANALRKRIIARIVGRGG